MEGMFQKTVYISEGGKAGRDGLEGWKVGRLGPHPSNLPLFQPSIRALPSRQSVNTFLRKFETCLTTL
jgi:hypothetical protein